MQVSDTCQVSHTNASDHIELFFSQIITSVDVSLSILIVFNFLIFYCLWSVEIVTILFVVCADVVMM